MIQFLLKFLQAGKASRLSPEELQALFKTKYKNFRALLTANNNALGIMAEMERVQAEGHTFGITFVHAKSTALMVNVFKMVRHLLAMSEGRYLTLDSRFHTLQKQITAILDRQPPVKEGPLVLPLAAIDRERTDLVGGKMANLGEVRNRVGLAVPDGFVISAAAGQHFIKANNLADEINQQLQTLDPENLAELYRVSASVQKLITTAPLPADLERAILDQYHSLEGRTRPGITTSMRSSAIGEDTQGASFAGQYRTELHVCAEFLGQVYKEILASKYTSQAITYRIMKGYRAKDISMAVGCLAMVEAAVSGVIYTRDPADLRSVWLIISAVPGLARAVVDGTKPVDMFWVGRAAPHHILLSKTREESVAKSPAVGTISGVPPAPLLTEEQARELARLALKLEEHFRGPQDIEWSIDTAGKIIILQSRPVSPAMQIVSAGEVPDLLPVSGETVPAFSGGVTASPGVACGPVHQVHSNVDLLQFPKGAVLVVHHPLPHWAPALAQAAAVISETGGLAGHLATVAREFGVPALFGLDKAMARLNNGELVTVDATGRRVYTGRQEDLLAQTIRPPSLMDGSPVQKTLKDILALSTPLHLVDPNSPYFRPSECKTLHDITRFCHEKAVSEMFEFGTRKHFYEKAAKRLVTENGMPSEWWVIDLEDGFRKGLDVTHKAIRVADIVSAPMLALWQGIFAIPWEGPPPVNVRGFGEIIFRSTMNPHLEPAVRSVMTAKNYFLVSKNYCSLSVRLGYHFSMVEAYLSDLLIESYVSFHFKGGAADARRRALRIRLIADILEQFDFRVEYKGDALSARYEKKPQALLVERLQILGYLIMHTRQIDMVMEDQNAANRYRQRLLADITSLQPAPEQEKEHARSIDQKNNGSPH